MTQHNPHSHGRESSKETVYIYGKHAVMQALSTAPQSVIEVVVLSGGDDVGVRKLVTKLADKGAHIKVRTSGTLPQGVDDAATHQGLIAQVSFADLLVPYKTFAEGLKATPDTCLVILGELQDVQNVGAVIRSAAAFGVTAVLVPEHNQAPINGTVVKVSAGMVFAMPIVSVPNINNAVRDLKDRGFWIYGLEGEAKKSLSDEKFDAPAVFILGNEAHGIRQKTLELCDIPLRIPTHARTESLNAAASAATALYAWSAQHPDALRG